LAIADQWIRGKLIDLPQVLESIEIQDVKMFGEIANKIVTDHEGCLQPGPALPHPFGGTSGRIETAKRTITKDKKV
jgi:hypothetical protein